MWLDIDTEVWQYPYLLCEDHDFAIYNWIAESFKIMSNNIADRENREELKSIKSALDRLEGANTFDIYAESDD